MNTETQIRANRLGTFDLFKGISMVLIVYSHTTGLFDEYPKYAAFPAVFSASFLAAFLIISSFGFRKTRVGKCIRLQSRFLLLPYLYVTLGTVVLHFFIHANLFYRGNLPGLLMESIRVAGGFLFGFAYSADYFGFLVYHCGPIWFMLALFFGWIILDIIMNVVPQRFVPVAVLLTATAGWLLGENVNTPFCLAQAMVAALFLFTGYEAKRRKLFDDRYGRRYALLLAISGVCIVIAALVAGTFNNFCRGTWTLGPVGIALCDVFAVSLVYFLRRLNYRDSRLSAFLENIGHHSMGVFCFHTVEMLAVPWNHLPPYFENRVFLGVICIFIMRCALIAILYFAVTGLKKLFTAEVA